MGGLTSRPNIPAPQSAASTQQTTTTTANTLPNAADVEADRARNENEQRTSNLLRRSRGVFGTIRTGFRGILDVVPDANTGRKTLLGE